MFERLGEVSDEHLQVLIAAERAAARAFVAQCEALEQLWDSTPRDTRVGRDPHVLAEAGTALGLHPRTVGARLVAAHALRRHRLLHGLLLQGRLGVAHLLAAVDVVAGLDDEDLADRVLTAVLAADGRLGWDSTPSALRAALTRTAVHLDPVAAAARRKDKQAAQSGVRLRPLPDGLAALIATGSAPALIAADRLLDHLSRSHGPHDTRTHGQRQIDALLDALVARAGVAVPLEVQLQIPVATVLAEVHPAVALPEPVLVTADLSPELLAQLTAATASAASTGTHPARPSASVPVPVPHPGAAAARPAGSSTAVPVSPAAASPAAARPAASPVAGTPSPTAPPPWQAAPRAPGRRPATGPAELVGHGPLDPAQLLDLLDDRTPLPAGLGQVRIRRVLIDRTGQAVAVDPHARPLAYWLRRAAPDAPALLRALLDELPRPPGTSPGYTPTADQTRVVRTRDPHCTFPGCAQRARRCQLDHRTRHPDGPTSTSNLHPLCQHHHRLKHDGWTCTRTPDGTTTWTSPRGQNIRSRQR